MVKRFVIFLFLLALGGQSLAITGSLCADNISTASEASSMEHAGHHGTHQEMEDLQQSKNCCEQADCSTQHCSTQFFLPAVVETMNGSVSPLHASDYNFAIHSPDLLSPTRPPIAR